MWRSIYQQAFPKHSSPFSLYPQPFGSTSRQSLWEPSLLSNFKTCSLRLCCNAIWKPGSPNLHVESIWSNTRQGFRWRFQYQESWFHRCAKHFKLNFFETFPQVVKPDGRNLLHIRLMITRCHLVIDEIPGLELLNLEFLVGTAIVTETKAALWTDGRYHLQAEKQLDSNWTLMRDGMYCTTFLTKSIDSFVWHGHLHST